MSANLEAIGQLAIDERLAQMAFKSACDRYDKETLSGRDNPMTYDHERLALLAASKALNDARDAFIGLAEETPIDASGKTPA